MDFRLKTGEQLRTVIAVKASSTVIEAGDFVAIDSGLIVKATATSTAIAWCPNGAKSGTTKIEVTVGDDFTLEGTGNVVFAVAQRGVAYNLAGTTDLIINQSASTIGVVKVALSEGSGVVGSKSNIEVKIAKPLF